MKKNTFKLLLVILLIVLGHYWTKCNAQLPQEYTVIQFEEFHKNDYYKTICGGTVKFMPDRIEFYLYEPIMAEKIVVDVMVNGGIYTGRLIGRFFEVQIWFDDNILYVKEKDFLYKLHVI